MGFSRQVYWSGLPCPPPGHLPDSRTEPGSPALQANSFTIWAMREAPVDFQLKWQRNMSIKFKLKEMQNSGGGAVNFTPLLICISSLIGQVVKILLQCRWPWLESWVRKIHWRRHRLPLPVFLGFPGGSDDKESAHSERNLGSIPRSERSPGEENGDPLQYSCLEKPMDRGAWRATVHGMAKRWTRLSN